MLQEGVLAFPKSFRPKGGSETFSRVESWRSGYVLYLQLPLIKPYVRFSRIRLSDYLHPVAFAHGALVGTSYRPKESK